jgi:predicted Zn-dependent protease
MDTYAWIQVQQGDVQEGLRLLKRAVAQLPNSAEVRYHHAVAVYKAGDIDNGMRLIRALLEEGGQFEGRQDAELLLEQAGALRP